MKNSSLPYWNERWGSDPVNFATSWPDAGCRNLELLYVKEVLRRIPKDRMVLEIGCGNFQLAEDPEIPELLKGRYLGVDGSAIAVQAAAARRLPGLHFTQYDLTVPGLCRLVDPSCTFLLSKRTLQNIHPESRVNLWREIAQFRGGLLIEDVVPFRDHLNSYRLSHGGQRPLSIPDFNFPIDLREEIWTLPRASFYAFMGYYYQITRVQRNVPDDIRACALRLSQWAIQTMRPQPANGPVVACHFGEWKS